MAAPAEITISDLTGDWVMNKELSDDTDPVLTLQNVGWLTRKAIKYATVTLHVKQTTSDAGVTRILIEQTATGGIQGTTEDRHLSWEATDNVDHVFGAVTGRTRWVEGDLAKGESGDGGALDAFLLEGWEAGSERWVQSYVVSQTNGWIAEQIWGFAEVGGVRRYTRRVVVKKGETVLKVRLTYDWVGKA